MTTSTTTQRTCVRANVTLVLDTSLVYPTRARRRSFLPLTSLSERCCSPDCFPLLLCGCVRPGYTRPVFRETEVTNNRDDDEQPDSDMSTGP